MSVGHCLSLNIECRNIERSELGLEPRLSYDCASPGSSCHVRDEAGSFLSGSGSSELLPDSSPPQRHRLLVQYVLNLIITFSHLLSEKRKVKFEEAVELVKPWVSFGLP